MKHLARSLFLTSVALLAFGACGGDDPVDPTPDATANTDIVEVDCNSTTAAEIVSTQGLAYSPDAVTINVGETIRFSPSAGHDVNSDNNLFDVPIAGEGCFRFNIEGIFPFHCTPHGFTGTVTVVP